MSTGERANFVFNELRNDQVHIALLVRSACVMMHIGRFALLQEYMLLRRGQRDVAFGVRQEEKADSRT